MRAMGVNLRWIVVSAPTGPTSPAESGGVDPGAGRSAGLKTRVAGSGSGGS